MYRLIQWLGLALLMALAVGAGRAQAIFAGGFTFEAIGDRTFITSDDLDFDTEGGIWLSARGVWRMSPGESAWQEVNEGSFEYIMATHPDTVYGASRGFIARSVDGGQTFLDAQLDTGGRLFETALGGPNRGLLLAGTIEEEGAAYSADRGTTWNLAEFETPVTFMPYEAQSFVEIHEVGPLGPGNVPLWPAGRLVAACFGGMAYSDNGGAFWAVSDVWDPNLLYVGWSVARVEGASAEVPRDRLVAVAGNATGQMRTSDDGGATWTLRATLPYRSMLVSLPLRNGQEVGVVLAVLVFEGSPVWASLDGGVTWSEVSGPILSDPSGVRLIDALLGPDERLYVTFARTGADEEWVWRTTEPVTVSNEPAEAPPLPEGALRVYPNPSGGVLHIEALGFSSQDGLPSGAGVLVVDVLGRVVYQSRTVIGRVEVDVSGLAPGLYVVRVGEQSAVVTVQR